MTDQTLVTPSLSTPLPVRNRKLLRFPSKKGLIPAILFLSLSSAVCAGTEDKAATPAENQAPAAGAAAADTGLSADKIIARANALKAARKAQFNVAEDPVDKALRENVQRSLAQAHNDDEREDILVEYQALLSERAQQKRAQLATAPASP